MALSALSTSAFKIGSIPLSTSVSPLFAANAPRKAGKVPDLTNTVAADLCRASAYSAGSELRQPRKDRQTAPSVMTHAKERRVRTCRCQLGTKIHRWQTREYISSAGDGFGRLPSSLRSNVVFGKNGRQPTTTRALVLTTHTAKAITAGDSIKRTMAHQLAGGIQSR